jgi:hypothetical protein
MRIITRIIAYIHISSVNLSSCSLSSSGLSCNGPESKSISANAEEDV